jgi:transposase
LIEAVADRLEGARVVPHRRWSASFKSKAVARSLEPGVNVSALARENGIRPQQLFGWRKAAGVERHGSVPLAAVSPGSSSALEIIVGRVTIRAVGDVSEDQLRRVLRAVRSA